MVIERQSGNSVESTFKAETDLGLSLIGKLRASLGISVESNNSEKSLVVGRGIDDLRFISEILLLSGRRLVIEDFHYLHPKSREAFAHDLKTFWDLKVYCVVIGIWTDNNMLVHLCPDLSNRIIERSVYWTDEDLESVITKGSGALRIEIDQNTTLRLVKDSFGTVGILQTLTLALLDEVGIEETLPVIKHIDCSPHYQSVAMESAEQLNAVYQTFATRVVKGIRNRQNSTGIYAHTLKTIMECSDSELTTGIHTDKIYEIAKKREGRIQKPNLRQILGKIEGLQVDTEGRGLILSYVRSRDEVTVVDKQLFFYRKYATVNWPWDQVLEDLKSEDDVFSEDNSE